MCAAAGSRLKDAVAQYTSAISSYHDVWTELDEIDREAWVIEPEAPTRANLHRRLALGPRSSVQVTLDPSPGCARAVPEIRFFGSEAAVAPLRASLNRALHAWSLSRSVVENLRGMLGVNLPSADDAREEGRRQDHIILQQHHQRRARTRAGAQRRGVVQRLPRLPLELLRAALQHGDVDARAAQRGHVFSLRGGEYAQGGASEQR